MRRVHSSVCAAINDQPHSTKPIRIVTRLKAPAPNEDRLQQNASENCLINSPKAQMNPINSQLRKNQAQRQWNEEKNRWLTQFWAFLFYFSSRKLKARIASCEKLWLVRVWIYVFISRQPDEANGKNFYLFTTIHWTPKLVFLCVFSLFSAS